MEGCDLYKMFRDARRDSRDWTALSLDEMLAWKQVASELCGSEQVQEERQEAYDEGWQSAMNEINDTIDGANNELKNMVSERIDRLCQSLSYLAKSGPGG